MVKIENTYAEAFQGIFTRMLITAKNKRLLIKAAENSTALPSVVIGRTEAGIECFLDKNETPDRRPGAVVQFWGAYDKQNPEKSIKKFEKEISYRIRQGILVVPTTTLFNHFESKNRLDMMERVGHCGDGYEFEEEYLGRRMINIPIMMGEFRIERFMCYGFGVMGANIWFMCRNISSALRAGEKALRAIREVKGVITPFGICSAGSKPETKFPEIGPTTNHPYCPTLRGKIPDSKVPRGVGSIPEIVINGISLDAVKKAMRAAIKAVLSVKGVVKISAGNYGGKLGEYRIYLRDLIEEI